MNRIAFFLYFLVLNTTFLFAQSENAYNDIQSAQKAYENDDFETAELAYRRALEKQSTPTTQYNLGNSLYQQGKLEEAQEQFQASAANSNDPNLKAKSLYNLGNTHFQQQQFQPSFEAYKDALMQNPQDPELRENILNAFLKLKQQEQEQEQQQNKENQEQKENEQNQEEQQNQEQQNQQEQQQEEQSEENQDSKGDKGEPSEQSGQQSQQPQDNMTKEEAQRLLKLLEQQEKDVKEKVKMKDTEPNTSDKDW